MTLVERYALSTCIDGCPACLAGACDLAGPTLSRQLLSRRLLRRVLLGTLAAEAVDLDAASTAAEAAHLTLSRPAPDWFVVRGRNAKRYVEVYQLLLRDCSPFEEIVDYASGETIAIFQRAQHADT